MEYRLIKTIIKPTFVRITQRIGPILSFLYSLQSPYDKRQEEMDF